MKEQEDKMGRTFPIGQLQYTQMVVECHCGKRCANAGIDHGYMLKNAKHKKRQVPFIEDLTLYRFNYVVWIAF